MLLKSFFILFAIPCCLCIFFDCGSKPQTFLRMSVSNCSPQADRCVLKKGKDVAISITFTNISTNKVQSKESAKIPSGNIIPFPLPVADGCKQGINCPVSADQTNTYTATIPVLKMFPRLVVDVIWQLLDDSGSTFICVVIPSIIQ